MAGRVCERLRADDLDRKIDIPMPNKVFTETVADTLLHVFLHGQHHRGQIHSMLSGTSVAPPQLDEFTLSSDDEARAEDLPVLGWNEERLTR